MSRTWYPAPHRRERSASIVTAGGWARSGKGTSMAYLKDRIKGLGHHIELFDQGLKFRTMADVAIRAGQPLDSPTTLNDFIQSPRAQKSTLAVLAETSGMDDATIKDRLYTPQLSKASGKIGKVPAAHEIAVKLLRTQVEEAVEAGAAVILIDGRSIEKYARQFTREGLASFVMGWHFKCDPAIAARRSLGLFSEYEDLTSEKRHQLLAETLNISDRNKADSLRGVDPLREPTKAYHLDLSTYPRSDSDVPYKRANDILHAHNGMAVVDTSYTNSIEEMTHPVTELTMLGLMLRGPLSHQDVGIEVAGSR